MKAPRWYWAFLVVNAAVGAASPLLPLYAYHLGGTAADVGAMSAAASMVNVIGSLLWGRLADVTARRRLFVLLSFAGLSLAYLALPFLLRVPQLILLNAGVSLVWTASATVSILILLGNFPRADWEREIGRFNVYSGVGWTLGLAIGAVWTSALVRLVGEGWGLRSLGLVVAVLAAAAAVMAARELREPSQRVEARSLRHLMVAVGNFLYERFRYGPTHLQDVLRPSQLLRFLQGRTAFGPELVLCYYGALLAFVGFATTFVPFPIFVRQALGWSNELVFALYVAHHGVSVLAFGWARRAVAKWGHRPAAALALLGRTGIFIGFAVVGGTTAKWMLPILFGLAGATWSFFQLAATALVSRLSPQGLQGQGLGLYNAIAGLGNVLGALAGGYLAEFVGFPATFLCGAVLVFLTMPILLVEGRPVS
ncbi:MFS transporter [Candidatus Bipolaricaulota bacterium]|nr:MFS transporter [Candidatus Bipolaricaulota bacterium]